MPSKKKFKNLIHTSYLTLGASIFLLNKWVNSGKDFTAEWVAFGVAFLLFILATGLLMFKIYGTIKKLDLKDD